MAGSRKGSGRPLKRVSSANRLREQLNAELASLTDPRDRVVAAADYVRAALARRPGRADVAAEVVKELTGAGDRILELGGGAA